MFQEFSHDYTDLIVVIGAASLSLEITTKYILIWYLL